MAVQEQARNKAMTPAHVRRFLRDVPVFHSVDDAGLDRLQESFHQIALAEGARLFEKGDGGDRVFVLLSGRLVAHRLSTGGRNVVLSIFRPGSLFGEMAVLEDQPRSLSVYAETDCRLLQMPTLKFRENLLAQPIIALNLATELCRRLRNMNDQMFGLVTQDVEARICLLLLRLVRESGQVSATALLRPAPTQEVLAARIGANREAVSRALSRLRRLGLIDTSRQNILIRDVDALAAHAEA